MRGPAAIVVATLAGALAPPPASAGALVSLLVVALVYTSLHGFSTDSVVSVGSASAVALALATGYLLLPGLAAVVGPAVLPERTALGLFVVLAGPTTVGSAVVWTRLDDGDVALTTAVAALSVALSPVVVPALFLALRSTTVALDPVAIGLDLLAVLGRGVLARAIVPAARLDARDVGRLALATIAVLVYVAVGTADLDDTTASLFAAVAGGVLLADGVVLLAAGVGGRLLGLDRPKRRSVVYAGGLKNLAIPLLVAASIDAAPVLPVVLFYVLQQVAGSIRAGPVGGQPLGGLVRSSGP